ncbi:unnamed protein product [Acanthoscelides obtectus]|uniref:Uncharacterized protein n=1 Tax=Acanthoscelides obtectus TaxID=200917 RepID=A0A9P0PVU3_ACAOB|nr:unnamed protein product [Acanthoscelides obtectus]CAK1659278.1 hypothetical protein AOBTE_LOCUS21385 [Acanthoscelides obtectus]
MLQEEVLVRAAGAAEETQHLASPHLPRKS